MPKPSISGVFLAILVLARGTPSDPAGCGPELFRIERSLNANVVVYQAVRNRDGGPGPKNLVEAHWILLADRGQVESLSVLERLAVYGFDVEAGLEGAFTMRLRACRERPIELRTVDGCLRAIVLIQRRPAILTSVFVKMRESGGFGAVESVALRGVEAGTANPLEEWLRSGASAPHGLLDGGTRP